MLRLVRRRNDASRGWMSLSSRPVLPRDLPEMDIPGVGVPVRSDSRDSAGGEDSRGMGTENRGLPFLMPTDRYCRSFSGEIISTSKGDGGGVIFWGVPGRRSNRPWSARDMMVAMASRFWSLEMVFMIHTRISRFLPF